MIKWERQEISSRKSEISREPFHAKMGIIKDRNGMDLTEAENIEKRWQEYTELYKKDLDDPDNQDGMITPRARYPGVLSQVGLRKHH